MVEVKTKSERSAGIIAIAIYFIEKPSWTMDDEYKRRKG